MKHQWAVTHAFYAILGGFIIDVTEGSPRSMSEDMERVASTPRGLELLSHAARGMRWYSRDSRGYSANTTLSETKFSPVNEKTLLSSVPDIPETHILDRSKADGVTKMLFCFQALWFCV